MDWTSLTTWRNIAVLLLGLEAFLLMVPLLIALFFAVQGLRTLRGLLEEQLPVSRAYVKQAQEVTEQVSRVLVAPPIRLRSLIAGIRAGVLYFFGRR